MKKIIYLLALSFSLSTIYSCSSGGNSTPKEVAESYIKYVKAEKFDKIVNLIDKENYTDKELESGGKMATAFFEEAMKSIKEQKGGIKDIEVVSEEIDEDGNSATVTIKFIYGDDTTSENDIDLVKKSDGWKLDGIF